MKDGKRIAILAALALSAILIAAALSAALTANHFSRAQFQALSAICEGTLSEQPEAERAMLSALNEFSRQPGRAEGADFLRRYGYAPADFARPARVFTFAAAGFSAGALLFALTCALGRDRQAKRIRALAEYLEGVHAGSPGALLENREDEFSKLQDEIYKTVTSLHQTRDRALEARRRFADNLSNIAHQLKTPVTSISLALQLLKDQYPAASIVQVERQLSRLTHLEEALLLLARVDAGTLPLARRDADVFTVLTLAADNLQGMLRERNVSIEIPELGAATIHADMDWTMEAMLNLMKNCAEHAPAGSKIRCHYAQNPIYTLIQIWDEGRGFSPRDIPHLFERFYRGEGAAPGGIGIGLSLAKEILELQDGTIRAENLPGGGARFEIRMYSHQTVTFA